MTKTTSRTPNVTQIAPMVKLLARVIAGILVIVIGLWLRERAWSNYLAYDAIDSIPKLLGQGEYDQAQTKLEQLLGQSPNNAELHRLLGRTQSLIAIFRKDNQAKAASLKVLQKSVKLDPLSATNWYELANAYHLNGQAKQTEQAYQKTLQRDPYNSEYLFRIGFYFERKQQLLEAAKYYSKSLSVRLDPVVQEALARVKGTP